MDVPTGFAPRRILCPVDMSDLSDLALKYAHVGARLFGAELTVLNALHVEYPRYLSREFTSQVLKELDRAKADARQLLAGHVQQILGDAVDDEAIHYRSMDLEPAQAILQTIDEIGAELVVLGTHGYSGFKHWILGSVAEKVLHLSRVPVFTVRQKAGGVDDTAAPEARPDIREILCPCKQTPSAVSTLQTAVALAQRLNARLTVLHIEEAMPAQSKKHLQAWIEDHAPQAGGAAMVIRQGEAAHQIVAAAGELASDLIVIGIGHRPFGEGTVVGRTTERVTRHAPVPVLTVPFFLEG